MRVLYGVQHFFTHLPTPTFSLPIIHQSYISPTHHTITHLLTIISTQQNTGHSTTHALPYYTKFSTNHYPITHPIKTGINQRLSISTYFPYRYYIKATATPIPYFTTVA
jgi:hypothetical protein